MNTEKRCCGAQDFFDSRLEYLREVSQGRPFWTMHLLPCDHESSPLDLNSTEIRKSISGLLVTEGGIHRRPCPEGFIVSENSGNRQCRHVLAFHDGKIEFFNTAYPGKASDRNYLPWRRVFSDIHKSLEGLLRVDDRVLTFPSNTHVALVDYQDYKISLDIQQLSGSNQPISKNTITKSLGAIDSGMASDVFLKPFFDDVFAEAGQRGCPAYREDGTFLGF